MAERINLVPGSEDGVRAAAAVVFSRPHGREDCEEEQAHRVGVGAVLCEERTGKQYAFRTAVRKAYKTCMQSVPRNQGRVVNGENGLPGAIKRDTQFTAYGILTRKLILRPEPYA